MITGEKAPLFKLKNQDGKDVSLSDYFGKRIMLVFYPKDNSTVCTNQLCEYSDSLNEFEELGIIVFGISNDSVDSHKKFKEKNSIKFDLLSDETKEVCRAYDVLSIFNLPRRAIFFIDENGYVIYENTTFVFMRQRKYDLLRVIEQKFR
ncbi:MAG: bacterioferritin comigratory protein [Chlorobi bacterium OLB4]|jgi:Peroxiredoxin|nr:MAG: bacterioferritin comigratory protein [Chlorobi bacterium OLB4]MBW7854756.1 peroxiredoxin [Ignavibacteria bacterium]OQY78339.1 MAG: hypothetical protein B6D43_02430 [Ignavibacteriales bacterium UTCHB1]